jgi:hypothetical protein
MNLAVDPDSMGLDSELIRVPFSNLIERSIPFDPILPHSPDFWLGMIDDD